MKRLTILMLVSTMLLLSACATAAPVAESAPAGADPVLVVSGGDVTRTFSRADMEAMPVTQAAFKDVTYKGVTVTNLIQAAGFDPAAVKSIKAVASDGYTINYDPPQVINSEVIVAYAAVNGELTVDDGAFRMVVPGAEGSLNIRMLTELQITQ